jgi:hypothetical protein
MKEEDPVVERLNACPHPEIGEMVPHGPLEQELQVIVVVKQVVPVPHPLQLLFITI